MHSDRLVQQLGDQRERQAHEELGEGSGLLEFMSLLKVSARASAAGAHWEEDRLSAATHGQVAASDASVPPPIYWDNSS